MIEINDIIELQTNSKTERLTFATKYLVQNHFTFDLSVVSQGFSGNACFCVEREQIEKICHDLINMHSKLSGTTILYDYDSDGFIKFAIEPNGHLNVLGQVGGTHQDHYVKFRFQTDQTSILQLVRDFKAVLMH